MNLGFTHVTRSWPDATCVVLHDVDVVPVDDRNMYTCGDAPRHLVGNLNNSRCVSKKQLSTFLRSGRDGWACGGIKRSCCSRMKRDTPTNLQHATQWSEKVGWTWWTNCENDRSVFSGPMYKQATGGALILTPAQLRQVNGFSNRYWGWGNEDDDLDSR